MPGPTASVRGPSPKVCGPSRHRRRRAWRAGKHTTGVTTGISNNNSNGPGDSTGGPIDSDGPPDSTGTLDEALERLHSSGPDPPAR
ncbi:hypothetical protein OG349_21510 [Streptomyces sp. NBC_01317]|uniref:hypothetical protein n=1 Tax=Streptomyces sp. NBC_01317 TaxID=2903822 RepID=UPI002E0FC516|nr:hypothetical protein OG349_21510 [Streptomyces sp. NBC_01317]